MKIINFDKKTILTNIFGKNFNDKQIYGNFVNFKKHFTQIIDETKTKKLTKEKKYHSFN